MDSCSNFATINYNYLRPQKAEHLKALHEKSFCIRDDLKVETYKNGTVLPMRCFAGDSFLFGRGGLLDENGKYVQSSALVHYVQDSYAHTSSVKKDERVVFCGAFIEQWGHFLLQSTARLWYFLENDETVDKYVFIVDEGEDFLLKGNYLEFFKLLGVFDKLEFVNTPTTYREVILPELAFEHWKYSSPQFNAVFDVVAKNVLPEPSWKTYDKIFFTRSQFKKAVKSEFGAEMLDDYCKKNGYEIFAPESLSLSQMIYLIRNAGECAFVSGTVPHNMAFAREGQHCIIFERGAHNNDFQSNLNVAKRLNVTYIDSNISIYLVNGAGGPFILSYKGYLEQFTNDNGMIPPSDIYLTEKYMKKLFASYMKSYKRNYFYTIYMEEWLLTNMGHRYEAYEDSLKYYGKYLDGSSPYMLSHYFQLHYIKQLIKRIVKR